MRITVPTFVILSGPRKGDVKYPLNYNALRNINRFTLGAIKNKFYEDFKPELYGILDRWPFKLNDNYTFELIYTITSANKRKFDIANILSVVDKFACDCLVKEGLMPEDNWANLTTIIYKFGGVTGERICTLDIDIDHNNKKDGQ